MRNINVALQIMILSTVCVTGIGQAVAGHWLVGSVSIRSDSGNNVYGERLAVFLVSRKNPVSAEACVEQTHPQQRIDCINNTHLDFYKRFQQQQQHAGYLIAQTVTSETGNFAFIDPPVGRYYVLVKFPSMIDGHKVAWQEPVTVTPDRISVVTLNEDNLVLPKNRRR